MRPPVIFATMLRQRPLCLGLLAMGAALVAANMAGLAIWPCTFHEVTGRPCPGCGVTRGLTALLHGRWAEAWHWHPFTPLLTLAGLLLVISCVLPVAAREQLVAWVEKVERRTGFVLIALLGMMAFGTWRIFACPHWP